MTTDRRGVLLIDIDPEGNGSRRDPLRIADGFPHGLDGPVGLGEGLALLGRGSYDIVLLSSAGRGERAIGAVRSLASGAGSIPIVLLMAEEDKAGALEAIRAGAQDCLVPGPLPGEALQRVIRHAIARKRFESHLKLAADALRLLNRTNDLNLLVRDLLRLIRDTLEFDAVGLRLRAGEDFPYFHQIGFPDEFASAENTLCSRDLAAAIVRDAAGLPLYACTCGAVLSGAADGRLPGLMENGSFWTNDASALSTLAPDVDPRHFPRNRCIQAGYRSLALIPLRSDGAVGGLLQLNDRRPGRISPDLIPLLEGLTESIGIAVRRQRTQADLKESEDKFRYVFDHSVLGKSITLPSGAVSANRAFATMLGYTPEEMAARTWQEITHPDDIAATDSALASLLRGERESASFEKRYLRKHGVVVWAFVSTSLRRDPVDGRPLYYFTSIMDITARKASEQRIAAQLDELRRWHEATLGREDRVLLLKREVNDILAQSGRPPRYSSAEEAPSREKSP